ncbi:hypothetical protein L325_0121200 [Yersinia pestis 9]|nr:hypothetical protein L325_0121200 [Yersinia pestis 9]
MQFARSPHKEHQPQAQAQAIKNSGSAPGPWLYNRTKLE